MTFDQALKEEVGTGDVQGLQVGFQKKKPVRRFSLKKHNIVKKMDYKINDKR